MAINFLSKPNVDNTDSSFPLGKIKDDNGSGNGTPISFEVYNDMHTFFQSMAHFADKTLNDLPDSENDGYELLECFRQYVHNQKGTSTALSSNQLDLGSTYYGNFFNVTGTGALNRMKAKDPGHIVVIRKTDTGSMTISTGASTSGMYYQVTKAKSTDPDISLSQGDFAMFMCVDSNKYILLATSGKPLISTVYKALISQSGTSSPSVTQLFNDLGSLTFSRSGVGSYLISSSGLFTSGKTLVKLSNGFPIGVIGGKRSNNNTIALTTFDSTFNYSDNILDNCSIEIEVFY